MFVFIFFLFCFGFSIVCYSIFYLFMLSCFGRLICNLLLSSVFNSLLVSVSVSTFVFVFVFVSIIVILWSQLFVIKKITSNRNRIQYHHFNLFLIFSLKKYVVCFGHMFLLS